MALWRRFRDQETNNKRRRTTTSGKVYFDDDLCGWTAIYRDDAQHARRPCLATTTTGDGALKLGTVPLIFVEALCSPGTATTTTNHQPTTCIHRRRVLDRAHHASKQRAAHRGRRARADRMCGTRRSRERRASVSSISEPRDAAADTTTTQRRPVTATTTTAV